MQVRFACDVWQLEDHTCLCAGFEKMHTSPPLSVVGVTSDKMCFHRPAECEKGRSYLALRPISGVIRVALHSTSKTSRGRSLRSVGASRTSSIPVSTSESSSSLTQQLEDWARTYLQHDAAASAISGKTPYRLQAPGERWDRIGTEATARHKTSL